MHFDAVINKPSIKWQACENRGFDDLGGLSVEMAQLSDMLMFRQLFARWRPKA
jgi:hypothetical protein